LFNVSLPARDRYLDEVSVLPLSVREPSLFTKDLVARAGMQASPYDRMRAYLEERAACDPLSEMLYLDARTYLPCDILTKVDRMSMANSLEVRTPLLDHCFAEWAVRLSPRWKLRFGESKYILKRLAEKLGVPRSALYRRKQGFSLPLVHWFRKPQSGLLDILLEPRTLQRGYFSEPSVRRRLLEHRRGIRDRSWELWHLLVFELWHRNFLEPALRIAAATPIARPSAATESWLTPRLHADV
jgi:asparagine synthase (glutamine-hydrolysing)